MKDLMNQGYGRYEFTITVGATGENADEAWDCIVNAELFNDGAPEPDSFEPEEDDYEIEGPHSARAMADERWLAKQSQDDTVPADDASREVAMAHNN